MPACSGVVAERLGVRLAGPLVLALAVGGRTWDCQLQGDGDKRQFTIQVCAACTACTAGGGGWRESASRSRRAEFGEVPLLLGRVRSKTEAKIILACGAFAAVLRLRLYALNS